MAVEKASPAGSEPSEGEARRGPRRLGGVLYGGFVMPLVTTVLGAAIVANLVTARLDAQQADRTRRLELKAQTANEIATATVSFVTQDQVMVLFPNKTAALDSARFVAHFGKFEAATALIEAKLAAFYPTRALETTWGRLENALLDYDRLGSDIAGGVSDLEDDVSELKIDLGQVASRAPIKWDALSFPAQPGDHVAYQDTSGAYDLVGRLLIEEATKLTREALT